MTSPHLPLWRHEYISSVWRFSFNHDHVISILNFPVNDLCHDSIGNKLFGFIFSRSDEPIVIGVCGMRSADQDHRIVSEPIASGSFLESGQGLCYLGISLQQWKDASLHRKRQVWVVMISLFLAYECIDGLMQERHNSIANALELCLSCTNQLVWSWKADFPHRKWIVRKVFSKHAIIMTFQHQSYPLTPCYLCWKKKQTLSHLRGLPWTCPALWFTKFSKKYASFSQSCLLVVGYRRMFFIMGTRLGHKM